jgi:hypothetical protein
MFVYFFYYFTQTFLNDPLRKAYFAFLIIYVVVSALPRIMVIIFERTFDDYNRSACSKFVRFIFLIVLSLIQGEYLWVIFFYNFEGMTYNYKEGLKGATFFSRMAQMFVQVTMITILGINEVDNGLKIIAISLSGFQFVFNIIMGVCIYAR